MDGPDVLGIESPNDEPTHAQVLSVSFMTDITPQLLRPVAERHSLDEVAFLVAFDKEVPEDILVEINEHWKQTIIHELPKRSNIEGVMIETDIGKFPPRISSKTIAGVRFEKYASDGKLSRSLAFHGPTVVCTIRDYSSWSETWPNVRGIFRGFWSALRKNLYVPRISLKFTNRFFIDREYSDSDATIISHEAFNKSTPYLTPRVLKSKRNWHCQQRLF